MAYDAGLAELLREALEPLGAIAIKRMFGGAGVYADGQILGLLIEDRFYFKAGAATQARYMAEGMAPFAYEGRGRTVITSYWRVPDRLLDEPDELLGWARQALADARAAQAGHHKKQKKTPAAAVGKRTKARSPRA